MICPKCKNKLIMTDLTASEDLTVFRCPACGWQGTHVDAIYEYEMM